MTIERRSHFAEVRAVTDDGEPMVTLRAIRPNVVDDYGTLWDAHSLDDSLAARLPTLVWGHDWVDPIGRGVDYRLSDEGPDVMFAFDDFDAVPRARQAYAQTRSGTIQDCSVGFVRQQWRPPTDEEREQFPGVKEVMLKAQLDEISLVLRGAVPGAKVMAVRSVRSSYGDVTEDQWLTVARKLAAGELTEPEAQAAMRLVATPAAGTVPPSADPPAAGVGEGVPPAPPDATPPDEPADVAEMLGDLDTLRW